MATASSDTVTLHIQATTLALLSKCEMKKHIRCESEVPPSMKPLVTFSFPLEVDIYVSLMSSDVSKPNWGAAELCSLPAMRRKFRSKKNRLVKYESWKSFRNCLICAIPGSSLTIIWQPGTYRTYQAALLQWKHSRTGVFKPNLEQ